MEYICDSSSGKYISGMIPLSRSWFALLAVFVVSCTVHPGETGTHDSSLDAEVREIRFHDTQLELLNREIDSLQTKEPRNDEDEGKLAKARARKSWHETQREEAIRRANERGQNWNMLYNQEAARQEDNRILRQPPR